MATTMKIKCQQNLLFASVGANAKQLSIKVVSRHHCAKLGFANVVGLDFPRASLDIESQTVESFLLDEAAVELPVFAV